VCQAGGIAKKMVPKLTGLREVVTEGMYTLTLEFDDNCPFEEFDSRQAKIEGFFGPGVKAVLTKTDAGMPLRTCPSVLTHRTAVAVCVWRMFVELARYP
jgi:hypothetical protein